MRTYTFRERANARALPAVPEISHVEVTARTLAARFPTVHRVDQKVASVCASKRKRAMNLLANESDSSPKRAAHTLAKVAALFGGSYAAGSTYRAIGAKRDHVLGLVVTSKAVAAKGPDVPAAPAVQPSHHHLFRASPPAEQTPLLPSPAPVPSRAARLGQGLRASAAATQHAIQLSLALGASGMGIAVALPTGYAAAAGAYAIVRTCLHLEPESTNVECLKILSSLARTLELPLTQRLWLLVHHTPSDSPPLV